MGHELIGSGLPRQHYRAILADPPWDYTCKAPTQSMRPCLRWGAHPGSVLHYYDTLPLQEIQALPVGDLATADACLFLWATVPLLPQAFTVLAAWGFTYKTMLTWYKTNRHGMGYWFRGYTEHVLVGTRGQVHAFHSRRKNVIECKVDGHSRKPEQVHLLIEEICQPPYLELFGRQAREGWTVWGDHVEHDLFA